MTIERTSVIRQSEEQVAAEVDGEVVMMSVEQGNYYGLDEVGSRIWQLIETPTTLADLCEDLTKEFDVEPATCEEDVVRFLEELAAQGLVKVDGAAG
ncbi:Coenzyme PQQ synthesis protein D (PqqD) [Thioflavicoccus mobilis 8321]|uniref:Coenzyme PQQ synthesis protein D (PqqD) n=1 Tax=Thioflavicoccus mobilis 8321 TaxID=765912 RepID=L0GZP8_9GAMM|nr:lasso peptide biosynthesis PqqD family chaperone [Thioflavicoccus mobilis]AGA92228.1 Coenzyme PQQ synthesis protein D (PqqD) [Thioflavicoccus mobilis 8321]